MRERNEQAMREGRRARLRRPLPESHPRAAGGRRWPTASRARFASAPPTTGRSTFVDVVRGEVSVEWATISDFVIVRSNGTPVFFLANAVDDVDMHITHVLRGEDLIDSTHRVLALRRALGHDDQPVYAHMPLILGPGGAKLSKRHGAVSVEEYRDAGYLPHALVNYLALLGWGPEDGREVLTIDELIAEFDVARVTPSPATFDPKKLEWMNGEHIRRMPLAELVARGVAVCTRSRTATQLDVRVFERAVALAQERATTLVQIAEQAEFLFVPDDAFAIDENSWKKVVTTESAKDVLDAVIAFVEHCEWSDAIDVRPVIAELGLKPGKVMHVLYTAIEGTSAGLPLFDSIALLGQGSEPSPAARCPGAARRRVMRLLRIALRIGLLVVALVVRVPLGHVRAGVDGIAPRRARVRRRRSSCSAPRSTTAGRRRCSRRASITRSICTANTSRR